MSPLQHVAQIRRDTFWIDDENSRLLRHNPLSAKLRRTIEHLSEGLYSKDVHFIFELIQNAEDNQYTADVDPTLSFLLTRDDPTGTPGADGALIVENNEIGFQPEHIEAICDVGQSTKTKQEGYIGEKGIGFKSVFQVTADPHVFSNGYSIRLPESETLTGLGYIVPVWAKRPKELLKSIGTTLVLPLRPGSFQDLSKSLQQIAPETILFLKKLKSLCIRIEDSYASTVIKDDSSAPLVRLLCEITYDAKSPRLQEGLFWVKTINFGRPEGVSAAKRENILDRDVTVALPLSDRAEVRGHVYAYLPVLTGSGLPFLVNADFLLTSSREGIREDHPWNHWLRDCIGPCVVQAFCELLTEREHRYQAYRFLPLLADGERPEFFEGVAEQIHAGLAGKAIVVRQSGGDLITPQEARRADQDFRALFAAADPPTPFCRARLVSERIERFSKQLEQLGVLQVNAKDVADSLREVNWLATRPLDWFVHCYEYLQNSKIDSSLAAELRKCPIVPIEGQKLSCDFIQPIYLGASVEDKEFLQTVPSIIQAPIAFLRPRFRTMVEKDATLVDWLREVLGIYTFNQGNYCIDIAERLKREYRNVDELPLVAGTRFLAKYCSSSDTIHDLPVVLHDKRRELVSTLVATEGIQHVVTPPALDAANGWQHVFGSDQDRTHLAILSNRYAQDKTVPVDRDSLRQFLCGLGITDTPLPRRHVVAESNTTEQSEYEKACFAAITERSTRINIVRNTVSPGWLSQLRRGQTIENLDRKARALTAWLRRQASSSIAARKAWTEARVEYFYYDSHEKAYQSEFCRDLKSAAWLPTSIGPVVPKAAFIKDETISAVLGDAVPYLSGDLPEWALDLLEVRRTAAPKDLVGALATQAEAGAQNPALALKVYNLLDHLTAGKSLRQEFWDKPLIHVPHQGRGWFRSGEVVWSDRSETFGDAFAYLEPTYPKLREFFVEQLGVKPDVDSESFANRWLALAAQAPSRAIEVEGPMTQITTVRLTPPAPRTSPLDAESYARLCLAAI